MKKLLCLVLFSAGLLTACNKETTDVNPGTTPQEPVVKTVDGGCGSNCSNTVSASFSIDNLNGQVKENEDLKLSNLSDNAASYEWDFGNGDKSYLPTPVYRYAKCGSYTITLRVKGSKGETDEMSQPILVSCL